MYSPCVTEFLSKTKSTFSGGFISAEGKSQTISKARARAPTTSSRPENHHGPLHPCSCRHHRDPHHQQPKSYPTVDGTGLSTSSTKPPGSKKVSSRMDSVNIPFNGKALIIDKGIIDFIQDVESFKYFSKHSAPPCHRDIVGDCRSTPQRESRLCKLCTGRPPAQLHYRAFSLSSHFRLSSVPTPGSLASAGPLHDRMGSQWPST